MKIAIASGKGGTGKTTLSVNLALTAGEKICLLDCDVEEPNAHLFLKTKNGTQTVVTVPVPEIDEAKCTGCGACGEFCEFGAIAAFGTVPYISTDMCHGCGGCMRVCPRKAIREVPKRIGIVEKSESGDLTLVQGRLDVGVALAPPLIRAVKKAVKTGAILLDAPPGTSCPVVATLKEADYVLLVAEPTPFGLNDFRLAVDVVRELKLPFGAVINRAEREDPFIRPFCASEKIPILAEIPDDRRIAQAYAIGTPLIQALPEYKPLFAALWDKIRNAS